MNFFQAISSGFSNYTNFSGRARRSEYWYWILFAFLGGLLTNLIDAALLPSSGIQVVNLIFGVVTFLPGITVGARRLHDIDRSGWWLLLCLTIIGVLVLIYWFVQPSNEGPNRFGESPIRSEESDDTPSD